MTNRRGAEHQHATTDVVRHVLLLAQQALQGGARQAVYEARTSLRDREEGRAMECEHVRKAISDRDGRRLRGRKLRAHLNGCDGCRGFAASISPNTPGQTSSR